MFVCSGCGVRSSSPYTNYLRCPGHPADGACHFVSEENLEPDIKPFFEEPMKYDDTLQPDEPQPDIAPAPKGEPELPPLPPPPKKQDYRTWNKNGLTYTNPPKPQPFKGEQVIARSKPVAKKVSKGYSPKKSLPPIPEPPAFAVRRRLKDKYPAGERRVWKIVGEDRSYGGMFDRPDCPQLGLVEGTYESALEYALELPDFISYGQGGTIEPAKKIPIKKLD